MRNVFWAVFWFLLHVLMLFTAVAWTWQWYHGISATDFQRFYAIVMTVLMSVRALMYAFGYILEMLKGED